MNAKLALSLGLALALFAHIASGQARKNDTPENRSSVSYVITIDRSAPQVVDVDLAASSNRVVQLQAGYTLTLRRGNDRTLLMSELKAGDGRVLHKRQARIPAGQTLKVAYLICNGQVTHISPAPSTPPKCQS